MNHVDFESLRGQTLVEITGCEPGSDCVTFVTDQGRRYRLFHDQDCCETVDLNDIIGEPVNLLNTPLLMASLVESEDIPPPEGRGTDDSYTWSFYKLGTLYGYVTLRWFGESNGYYSETVSFVEEEESDRE
jgi:hypothetical protein